MFSNFLNIGVVCFLFTNSKNCGWDIIVNFDIAILDLCLTYFPKKFLAIVHNIVT
jgi:hypothetical protein